MHFAGGGTGGHVYPNLAVAERLAERLAERGQQLRAVFLVSDRAVDARVVAAEGLLSVALPARPLAARPDRALRFAVAFRRARRMAACRIEADRPVALLASGGFVSGPALVAASARGVRVPTALVALDAVAGRAARWLARRSSAVFQAMEPSEPGGGLPGAPVCGHPVRRASLAAGRDAAEVRVAYGLEPSRPTLLAFAGSSGAETLNRGLPAFFAREADGPRGVDGPRHSDGPRRSSSPLAEWQVLHLTGGALVEETRAAYAAAGVRAEVRGYEPEMGRAWAAADLAVTRCGAGGVAEARANAVPCVFLPYPWHRDGHQERNARPLVNAGGAVLMTDAIDPGLNAAGFAEHLRPLLEEPGRRAAMRAALAGLPALDGAGALAAWLLERAAPPPGGP